MAHKPLPKEIVEKYKATPFIRLYNGPEGEMYIPDYINMVGSSDEVHRDLIGGIRTRPWQPGDGRPAYPAPENMRVWTRRNTTEGDTEGYFFVDARIEPANMQGFSISDVLFLAPSHWSPTLKNRFPGAIPTSGFLPARF